MKKFSVLSSTFLVLTMFSVGAHAATVVTGGKCTQKQMNNKLTSCETSEFTNSAGQTGYKCTCADKMVVKNPDLDSALTPDRSPITPASPPSTEAAPIQKAAPRN